MRARPKGRRAGATACWGNYLGVGTRFARMPSCCVNAVSWLQASFGSPNLRGRFQPSQGTHQSLTFPLQNSFQVSRNPLRKSARRRLDSLPPSGLTLQPHRPIPGISIKMSPERARACKLAFQTARLGAYQRESVCILGCASPTAISRRVWPSLAIASVHFWRSFIV